MNSMPVVFSVVLLKGILGGKKHMDLVLNRKMVKKLVFAKSFNGS